MAVQRSSPSSSRPGWPSLDLRSRLISTSPPGSGSPASNCSPWTCTRPGVSRAWTRCPAGRHCTTSRKQGLRLVVVATQDPQAGCVNPGWNPDALICDDDGTIARMLGAQDRLPAAFLWSWQGHLLVKNGHVDEVDAAISDWMRQAPRIHVQVDPLGRGAGIDRRGLRQLVRAAVADENKMAVVASPTERRALDQLKAESLKPRYDESLACELGKDLSANSLLEVRIAAGMPRPRLHLALLSAERGCMVASSWVDWSPGSARMAVREAVSALMRKLRPRVELPATASARRGVSGILDDGRDIDNPVVNTMGYLSVKSEPSGAQVFINGKASGRTPFQTELMVGAYVVVCRLGSIYRPARESIRLTRLVLLCHSRETRRLDISLLH